MSDLSVNTSVALTKAQTAYQTQTDNALLSGEEAASFSEALAREMAITMGGQAGTSATQGSSLDAYTPMLMTATAGQGLESQLLMLCFMLMTGQADASSIMSVLAQSVNSMSDSDEKESLRRSIMDSSYSNGILDQINEGVFGGTSQAYPYEAWKACTPAITNNALNRSAREYVQVIGQFDVETNGRYAVNKRGIDDTYCNIFVWDVTSAMGAQIPHYIDAATGAPRFYPNVEGATELSANLTYDWLAEYGAAYGWREVSAEQAQIHANAGGPAIASWKNPTGRPGHIQVVRPELEGVAYDPAKGPAVAQAGTKLTSYTHVGDIYSDNAMSAVRYYIHE